MEDNAIRTILGAVAPHQDRILPHLLDALGADNEALSVAHTIFHIIDELSQLDSKSDAFAEKIEMLRKFIPMLDEEDTDQFVQASTDTLTYFFEDQFTTEMKDEWHAFVGMVTEYMRHQTLISREEIKTSVLESIERSLFEELRPEAESLVRDFVMRLINEQMARLENETLGTARSHTA